MMRAYLLLLFVAIIGLTGCSEQNSAKELDYEQTKNMVVDILQTDEGKKALQEIITDEKMKHHLVMESDVVKKSITDTLASEEGTEMWKKLFEDPAFVASYQQSMMEEQKKLYKSLMNDAQFQKQMLELLQNPEIANQTLSVMKGQQFREHLEETIQQTLETPLFQAKIEQTLLKAAEKKQKSEEKDKKEEDSKEKEDGAKKDEEG